MLVFVCRSLFVVVLLLLYDVRCLLLLAGGDCRMSHVLLFVVCCLVFGVADCCLLCNVCC